ncbi:MULTISPECIES: aspartyl/asparaginyl beta-hydroxylase domain-containing protein [unclassified Sphingomonas]|jgi:Aspartyl/Asparaginyl beta-hydroxylase|nr:MULTISPECIES: aspartyl/asparaginyl beta-hydroxylase domain-containing protein [unclassified Sphingomonas]AXJ95435.1 aspartyl beta-hydroxylase [Sphingomonas sp. FARSPH]
MGYRDRIRLPLRFDADRLRADCASAAGDGWTPHFLSQNYDGDWSALPLRAPQGAEHPILMLSAHPGTTDFVDAPALSRTPYLAWLLAQLHCPLKVVRLMRLTPGSAIRRHCDPGLDAAEGEVRLHVPIQTNAGVRFLLNDRVVTMRSGELWYLRLADPHAVTNDGAEDRIHLVIDAAMNDWLDAQLRAGERAVADHASDSRIAR